VHFACLGGAGFGGRGTMVVLQLGVTRLEVREIRRRWWFGAVLGIERSDYRAVATNDDFFGDS